MRFTMKAVLDSRQSERSDARRVNLFLVGAAKAGTSSLWAALKQHEDIFAPEDELNKEPSYFTPIANHNGLQWYHSLYEAACSEQYLIDASTPYLTHPDAAAAIHSYNPEAKVIIVLRDPAARAYSLYCWMVAEGYEWASSFEVALELEDQRVKTPEDRVSMPNYFWNYMYKRSGLYKSQVDRFADLFGDRLLLIDFHKLISDPGGQLLQIMDFLDITHFDLNLERENPSRRAFSPSLTFTTRKLQQRLGNRFPHYFGQSKRQRDFLVRATTSKRRPPSLDPDTREMLDIYFANDLEALRTAYGLSLGHSPDTSATREG